MEETNFLQAQAEQMKSLFTRFGADDEKPNRTPAAWMILPFFLSISLVL
jgi:hypothetical protein